MCEEFLREGRGTAGGRIRENGRFEVILEGKVKVPRTARQAGQECQQGEEGEVCLWEEAPTFGWGCLETSSAGRTGGAERRPEAQVGAGHGGHAGHTHWNLHGMRR